VAKVLVSMEHADGVAAIVRTWRGLCLAGYAEQPSTLIEDGGCPRAKRRSPIRTRPSAPIWRS
jgi:hypothetical protein